MAEQMGALEQLLLDETELGQQLQSSMKEILESNEKIEELVKVIGNIGTNG